MTLPPSPGWMSARIVVAVASVIVAVAAQPGVPSALSRSTLPRLPSVQPATAKPSPVRPAFGAFTEPPPETTTPFAPQRSAPAGETACATIATEGLSRRVTTTALPAASMVRP